MVYRVYVGGNSHIASHGGVIGKDIGYVYRDNRMMS
jgi:hypothetical protein